MKFKTLQIVWHDKQPVFTIEFLSADVFATGGADKAIRTWRVSSDAETGPSVTLEADLSGTSGNVNCIRCAPKGGSFVSCGDKGEVIVWKKNPEFENQMHNETTVKPWKASACLRGHVDDVFDACWSSDGTCLATASLEGVTIIWDIHRERAKMRLCEHHHYVQGVAWDPFNQYLASQGGDRRCKIYARSNESQAKKETAAKTAGHWKVGRTLFKTKAPSSSDDGDDASGGQKEFLFHDDSLTSFFRRLSWSPDGSFLVCPAGLKRFAADSNRASHVAYIYSRGKWSTPVACLPGVGEPFVAIRFCPVLFTKCAMDEENALTDLPYDVVFACATLHNVFIYRSSDCKPVAALCGLHYSEITDLAWSPDSRFLMVSSRDGYCSVVYFELGEIGTRLDIPQLKSENPAAAEWFQNLDEIKQRVDLLPAKRLNPQPSPQGKPQASQENGIRRACEKVSQGRARRRITPVAVQSVEIPKPDKAEAQISNLLSSTRPSHRDVFSDLRSLAKGTEQRAEDVNKASQNPLTDLLAMTKSYASHRFGNQGS